MDVRTLQSVLTIGETIAVEFKRCGNGIEQDTFFLEDTVNKSLRNTILREMGSAVSREVLFPAAFCNAGFGR